ncbi:gamma-butyrobetaine hydroxylase-like domain-containing protein [Massilia sp. DD77]
MPGEAPRITAIEPVGAYALNLVFADGHRRGIYPYAMLDQPALAALHHA